MANAIYPIFKQNLLSKAYDLSSGGDSIKATLSDAADYTYSAAHDEYANDVAAAAKVAASGALTSPTVTTGTFDTADFTWSSVSGDECEQILLWDDTVANDPLIAFYDTGMTGMPVTPNGGDINVTIHASGWFAL